MLVAQDPKNLKALYRRAQGALGANDFDVATKDCKRILDLEPENKDSMAAMSSRSTYFGDGEWLQERYSLII